MKQLVFATNNAHKLDEVRNILGDTFEILGMAQIGCHDDIEETADTFAGNASSRPDTSRKNTDTTALPTTPASKSRHSEAHPASTRPVLRVRGTTPKKTWTRYSRSCRARATATPASVPSWLLSPAKANTRSRRIKGEILDERRGEGGFGYDPIFRPENETLTFAEMGDDRKNAISHRRVP